MPFVKPSETDGGGDCGFHAILGVWDGRRYHYAQTTQARQILYQHLVAKPLDTRLRPFLYDSIMALAMSENVVVGPHMQLMRQRYQQFLQQSLGDIQAAKIHFLQVFQQHPDVMHLLNQICPPDKHIHHVDVSACFTKAWNDDNPILRQVLLSKPALLAAKQVYVQAGKDAFNWHGDIDSHPELAQEYASYLAKPSRFLLLSDLGLVAIVFNKHIIYYTRNDNSANSGYYEALLPQPFKYSDEAPVYVLFNGHNHFERVEPNHIVATIDLIPVSSGASAHKPLPPKDDDATVIMPKTVLPDGLPTANLPSLKDIAAYLTKCSAPKGYTEAPLLATGFRGTEYQLLVLLDRMLSLKLAGFDFEAAVEADGYGNLDDIVLYIYQNKILIGVEAYQVKYYNHDISVRSFFNETDKKKKHEVMHIGKFFTGWLAIRDENRHLNDKHRPAIIYSNAHYDAELSKIISEGKLKEDFITRTMRLPLSQQKTPIKLTQEELYNQGLVTQSHSKRICKVLKDYGYLNEDGTFTEKYDEGLIVLNECVRTRFLKKESDLIPIRQYLNNKYQLHLRNQSDFYTLLHEQAFAYIQKKDGDNRHLKKTNQEKIKLFQQFLQSLVFQVSQPDIDAIEEQIKQKLISLYKAHSPYVFLCLYYGIREWFRTKAKDNKKVKITPDMLDEFVNQARVMGEYWQFLQGYSACTLQEVKHKIAGKFIFNPKTKLLFDESQRPGVTFVVGPKGMGKSSFVKIMLMYHEQPNYLFLSAKDIQSGANELSVKLQRVLSKIKYISVMVIDAAEVLLDMPVDQLKTMLAFINPLVRRLILTTTPDAQAYINKYLPEKTQVNIMSTELLSPAAIINVFSELAPYQTMIPLMQLAQQPFYLARVIELIGTNQVDFSHMISKKDVDLAYELVALVLQGQNPDAKHQRMLAVKWIAGELATSNSHSTPLALDSLQKSPNIHQGVKTLMAEGFVQQDKAGIRFSHDLFYEHAFIDWLHSEWKHCQENDKTLKFWKKIDSFLSSNEMRIMVYKWFAREGDNLIEDIRFNINSLKTLGHFSYFKIMPIIINHDAMFLFFLEQGILKANHSLMDINGVDSYILINLVILHHYRSGLGILIERGLSIHHPCRYRQQITYNGSNQMYYALIKDTDTKTSTTSSDNGNSDSDSSSNSRHSEDTTDSDSEGGYDLHYRSDDSQNIDSGADDDEAEQLESQKWQRKLQERLDNLLAFLERPQKYQLSGFYELEYISDEEDEYGFPNKVPNPDYQEKPDNATIYLFQAVMSGSVDCLLYLLGCFDSETSDYPDEIRAVNFINNCRESLLHVAVLQGHFKVAQFLIQNGAKINASDLWGDTPLHNAVYQSDLNLARLLLESGADESAANKQKLTPLHIAIAKLDFDMVKLLFEYNADFTDDDIFHIHQFDIADMLKYFCDNKYFYYESEMIDSKMRIEAFVIKLIQLLNYGQDNEEVNELQSAFVKRLLTIIPDSIQIASDHKGFNYYDRESEFDYALQQDDMGRIINLAEFIHDDDARLAKLIDAPQWQYALADIIAAWGGILDDFDSLIRVAYMRSRVDILQLIEPHCTDDLSEMIAALLAQKLASDLTLGTENTSQDSLGTMGAPEFTFNTSLTHFKSAQSSISSDDTKEDPALKFS